MIPVTIRGGNSRQLKMQKTLLKSYPQRLVASNLGPATELMEQTLLHVKILLLSCLCCISCRDLLLNLPRENKILTCVWKTWNNVLAAVEFISTGTDMNWACSDKSHSPSNKQEGKKRKRKEDTISWCKYTLRALLQSLELCLWRLESKNRYINK